MGLKKLKDNAYLQAIDEAKAQKLAAIEAAKFPVTIDKEEETEEEEIVDESKADSTIQSLIPEADMNDDDTTKDSIITTPESTNLSTESTETDSHSTTLNN